MREKLEQAIFDCQQQLAGLAPPTAATMPAASLYSRKESAPVRRPEAETEKIQAEKPLQKAPVSAAAFEAADADSPATPEPAVAQKLSYWSAPPRLAVSSVQAPPRRARAVRAAARVRAKRPSLLLAPYRAARNSAAAVVRGAARAIRQTSAAMLAGCRAIGRGCLAVLLFPVWIVLKTMSGASRIAKGVSIRLRALASATLQAGKRAIGWTGGALRAGCRATARVCAAAIVIPASGAAFVLSRSYQAAKSGGRACARIIGWVGPRLASAMGRGWRAVSHALGEAGFTGVVFALVCASLVLWAADAVRGASKILLAGCRSCARVTGRAAVAVSGAAKATWRREWPIVRQRAGRAVIAGRAAIERHRPAVERSFLNAKVLTRQAAQKTRSAAVLVATAARTKASQAWTLSRRVSADIARRANNL